MGRTPKLRAGNYKADAIFLINLSQAIEKDETLTAEEKKEAIAPLEKAISVFMRISSKGSSSNPPVAKAR
jgi:hypothetical protein